MKIEIKRADTWVRRTYGIDIGPLRIDWLDLWTGKYGWPELSTSSGRNIWPGLWWRLRDASSGRQSWRQF